MKMYELLSTPDKWTQHTTARNTDGIVCNAWDPEAASWCLAGAAEACYPEREKGDSVFGRIAQACGEHIVDWNDNKARTYQEVIELCRKLDI